MIADSKKVEIENNFSNDNFIEILYKTEKNYFLILLE